MNNEAAYQFYTSHNNNNISTISSNFIEHFEIDESEFETIRRKFSIIKEERRAFVRKSDLSTWNDMSFYPLLKKIKYATGVNIHSEIEEISCESDLTHSLVHNQTFGENLNLSTRKPIGELKIKGLRKRLSALLSHLEFVSKQEKVSSKTIASYLLMLCSQVEYDFNTAKYCKEIIAKGSFGPGCNELSCDKAAFIMDSLEIGKKKYIDLRRVLLSDDLHIPGYNRIAIHRSNICLVNDIQLIHRDFPIGVGLSYTKLLTHTINRLLMTIPNMEECNLDLNVRISDGLDGSGCHRVYQQANHSELSTKSFILFGFKVLSITNTKDVVIWKNPVPNSPFSIRPITILALPEKEENIRYLMDTLINEESNHLETNGLVLDNCKANVEILRSQLDGKMAKILSGAGGACCQFCTATFKQIHNIELVKEGFPINRSIADARTLFEEVNEEEFLSLSTDQRFNITHKPISGLNIIPNSPLHAYLRCFSWFLSLVSHLHAGKHKWSPTSTKVLDSKKFITSLINDNLNISIDIPSTQGGTSTTGNVTRSCFKRENDADKDFLYWILSVLPGEFKKPISDIHLCLGAILRVYNCNRRVDTEELALVCSDLYQQILQVFPWANITPTLHKVLAHGSEIISSYNDGNGLELLSEEGLEACNKHIRRYRERLSRKFCFEDNIKDVYVRMMSQSDPILLINRKNSKKTTNSNEYNSMQEILVNSLILDDY